MSEISEFLSSGFWWALHWSSYFHILFAVLVCVVFVFKDWKEVLIYLVIITATTAMGYTLGALKVYPLNQNWLDFLMACSLLATALVNILRSNRTLMVRKLLLRYLLAAFFGLVHGGVLHLAVLAELSPPILWPSVLIHLGYLAGLSVVGILFLFANFLFLDILGVSRRDWTLIISSAVGGVALVLLIAAWPWA